MRPRSSRFTPEIKVLLAAAVLFLSALLCRSSLSDSVEQQTRSQLLRLQMLLLLSSLMLIGSMYIWKRLNFLLSQGCLWQVSVLFFLVMAHLSFFTLLFLVSEEPHPIAMVAYTCLGSWVLLVFFLFIFSIVEQCHKLIRNRLATGPTAAVSGSNRTVLLALAVTLALTVIGLYNGARPPAVVRVQITVDKLPSSLNNLRLALLSDIHLGPTVGRNKLERVVRMVNELQPDIVAIVGDLTDSQVVNLQTASEPLRELKTKLGTYFVTGNHEYYTVDVSNWFSYLKMLNVQPLHNTNVRIGPVERSDEWLCLAGVDDVEAHLLRYPGHGMNLERALDGCGPDRAIILLAHQPTAAKKALQMRPDISLILSGHTHGGQIFPFTIAAYLFNPYFSGLYKVGERNFVYVTPGTVYYGIPMRIASRAEITEITLKSPS
ncbi:transmembrane protein with metallophosphoesterase domain [Erpetoichthys calabaricus]|uniref:transmembrane protein with metallophosphoesterase domain n=1 Tax=Erpetoichthys calabaricus TaxID=27687 RepID=UPI0010A0486B|nr:transmembrane protein with metallophosphoesterase domain [Erpetoichthys calabaricus]